MFCAGKGLSCLSGRGALGSKRNATKVTEAVLRHKNIDLELQQAEPFVDLEESVLLLHGRNNRLPW